MCSSYPGIKLELALENFHHILTSSTHLKNRSYHVVERTRTSSKCQKMKNAPAKCAKILFFIVKYANLWGFCCRRCRGCLNSLIPQFRPPFLQFKARTSLGGVQLVEKACENIIRFHPSLSTHQFWSW